MPDAARVSAGRTHPEHWLALQEYDVANPVAGQVVSGARSHAAASDYDYICSGLHEAKLTRTRYAPEASQP